MISNSGTTSLGLYDFKRQIDAFGGVDYFRQNLAGGYLKNARVMLANGDIVKSTIDGNTNDLIALITNSFVDKDGKEISPQTVKTILKPSKEEKRPNTHKRIDIDKLL